MSKKKGFETRAIHSGYTRDPETQSVMPPLFLSTTFAQTSPGKDSGFSYSRSRNPSRVYYEECLASLEEGKKAFAFASGCAATSNILQLFDSGTHVISFDDLYGGSYRLFDTVFSRHGFDFTFTDLTNIQSFEKAIQKGKTKLVWIETPTNPTLKMADIQAISEIAHKAGALVAVDNTFMTPYFQKPLNLGADFVMHSTTKYINGHSDVLGGAVIVKDQDLIDRLTHVSKTVGAVASPFDCYLSLRSLKTLSLRMRAHEENALHLAHFLEKHSQVERVFYPGLPSHPQFDLGKKQMEGSGGMLTFLIKGGLNEAKSFLEKLEIFSLAESLGGVESLACHPALMTHASIPKDFRDKIGVTDQLIRLSVGIESKEDLADDLDQALS